MLKKLQNNIFLHAIKLSKFRWLSEYSFIRHIYSTSITYSYIHNIPKLNIFSDVYTGMKYAITHWIAFYFRGGNKHGKLGYVQRVG